MPVNRQHRARIGPVADAEVHRTLLVVDILHAADAVLYHRNPADAGADHTAADAEAARHTVPVEDNRPGVEHTDHVVVEARRRLAVVGGHRMIAVVDNRMMRLGRSSLVAVEELRRSSAVVDSRRQSCRSNRWRTL